MTQRKTPRKVSPDVIAIIEKMVECLAKRITVIIEDAFERVIKRVLEEKRAAPYDCYKQTIKRIKAVPILKERIEDNKARLEAPIQEKSKSIVRFSADGIRADPEEMLEAIEQTLRAHIAADQAEVDEVNKALSIVSEDYYFPVVYDAFILGKRDEDLAVYLSCDISTIRRNRKRLVNIIAIRLYGVLAE